MLFRRRKKRKHPILRMEDGRTLRQFCFDEFDEGKRPGQIWEIGEFNPATVRKYHQQWLKGNHRRQEIGKLIKKKMAAAPNFAERIVSRLVDYFKTTPEEVKALLQKPYGLGSLIKGKWPLYPGHQQQDEQEERLEAALKLIRLMEFEGNEPDKVRLAIGKVFQELRAGRPQNQGAEVRKAPPPPEPEKLPPPGLLRYLAMQKAGGRDQQTPSRS